MGCVSTARRRIVDIGPERRECTETRMGRNRSIDHRDDHIATTD
jgi:hypothetical protein